MEKNCVLTDKFERYNQILEGLKVRETRVEEKFWQLWYFLTPQLDTVMRDRCSQGFVGITLSRNPLLLRCWDRIYQSLVAVPAESDILILTPRVTIKKLGETGLTVNNRYTLRWKGPSEHPFLALYTIGKYSSPYFYSAIKDFSPTLGIIFDEEEVF